ncbi:MAG: HAMP domain-containing protein [Ignavibacteriales bacterium]|nr:HAMP domain-containing protein [Ignavibacteriales bacterium]
MPILFFFMIYYPNQLFGIFEIALLNRYQEQAKAASFGLAAGMSTENYNLISEGVEHVKKNEELLYIIILDPLNEIIALNNSGENIQDVVSLKNLPPVYIDASIVRLQEPIVSQGKQIGHLLLGYSKNELDDQLGAIRQLSFLIGSISFALISLLTWLLSSKLTRPLVKMAHAASNFSKGGVYENVIVDTSDEVGELARSFNAMVEKIEYHHAALVEGKKFSDDLIASIPSALVTINASFHVVSVNNSFCRLFQVLPDMVEGKPIQQVLASQDFPPETIQSILYGKEFYGLEISIPVDDEAVSTRHDEMILQLGLVCILGQSVEAEKTKTLLLILEDITARKHAEDERLKLIGELQDATNKVKTLSGLLPICSSCKKIRDEDGTWNILEKYIHDHSEAKFTHGLCPECAKRYFPDQA